MDEGDLSCDITFSDTLDLSFSDLIHRFVPPDCSLGAPETSEHHRLTRRLMKRWSCSRRLLRCSILEYSRIAERTREAEVEPDTMADDGGWEAVAMVEIFHAL